MIINPNTDLGKAIEKYLRNNPMAVTEFAKRANVAPLTITNLLTGKALNVTTLVQLKIEKFLKDQLTD
jgi:predicted transcriptional regulator